MICVGFINIITLFNSLWELKILTKPYVHPFEMHFYGTRDMKENLDQITFFDTQTIQINK